MSSPILVLDTASPVVSVAVADAGQILAERTLELRRSSEQLLKTVEETLAEADVEISRLAGAATLQGPGSFTGLRIGLSTVLGFHQARGLPATAVPTLPVLAAAAAQSAVHSESGAGTVVAVVDAMRGDWSTQIFDDVSGEVFPTPTGERVLRTEAELAELAPARCIGFGIGRIVDTEGWPSAGPELVEPPPLAPVTARILSLSEVSWDPSPLTRPIYFRPPGVTLPKARKT